MAKHRMIASERSQAIMDATLELFAKHGCAGTTTREIAHAAGVSEALVFKHFPCKDDLYRAILEAKIAEAEKALPLGAELDALDDESFFRHLASNTMKRVAADDSFLRLLLGSALDGHELAHAFHHARIEKVRAVVEARVRRIYERNGVGPVDPVHAAVVWSGLVLSAVVARQIFRDPRARRLSVAEHSKALVNVFLGGIGARPRARA